jgi:hypothetical protein
VATSAGSWTRFRWALLLLLLLLVVLLVVGCAWVEQQELEGAAIPALMSCIHSAPLCTSLLALPQVAHADSLPCISLFDMLVLS